MFKSCKHINLQSNQNDSRGYLYTSKVENQPGYNQNHIHRDDVYSQNSHSGSNFGGSIVKHYY